MIPQDQEERRLLIAEYVLGLHRGDCGADPGALAWARSWAAGTDAARRSDGLLSVRAVLGLGWVTLTSVVFCNLVIKLFDRQLLDAQNGEPIAPDELWLRVQCNTRMQQN